MSLDWLDPSSSSSSSSNAHKLHSGAPDHDNSKGTANLQCYGEFGVFTSASDELSYCKFTITL